jgi:hypothetical protein
MSDTQRAAILTKGTTCITPAGRAGTVPPGAYLIVDIDGAAEQGELFIEVTGGLVAIRTHGIRIAEGTTPFVSGDVRRPGMVAGTCGHAVAGTEWLAGFRTCERCPADEQGHVDGRGGETRD